MTAHDMWLDPPDDEPEPCEFDYNVDPDDFPVGDYRSDERDIMLERRYDQ